MSRRLVILTDPIPRGKFFFIENAKSILRFARSILIKPEPKLRNSKYRGHFAVTRSLAEGLQKINVEYALNPFFIKPEDVVIVLAGIKTLEQAVKLKRSGKIKKLLAGPNVIVFSSDANNLIASPEVDLCIVPSDWTKNLYLSENSSLQNRIFSWPAGVDTNYWKPSDAERNIVTFFEKPNKSPIPDTIAYKAYLKEMGYKVVSLIYGEFTHVEYLKILQSSSFLVGFVSNESQGIAWTEAWSCDVPTFLWRNTKDSYKGKSFECSTAPYLTSQNGLFFDDFNQFQLIIEKFRIGHTLFSPRKWVIENMSDEVVAGLLLNNGIINL